MARQRMIHPEIWDSSDFKKLSNDTLRLAFIRLFSLADDEGKGKASVLMGFSTGYPQEIVHKISQELEKVGMIYFYGLEEGLDMVYYYQIPKWFRSQKINRPSPSKIRNHPNFKKIVPKEYHGKYSMNSFTEPIHGGHSLNQFTEPIHAEEKGREEKLGSHLDNSTLIDNQKEPSNKKGDSQFIHNSCLKNLTPPEGVPSLALKTLCETKIKQGLCTETNSQCLSDLIGIQARIKKSGGAKVSGIALWNTSVINYVMEYRATLLNKVKQISTPPTLGKVMDGMKT